MDQARAVDGEVERPFTPRSLEDLTRLCTVRISCATTGQSFGTGFFVAPGKVVTCVHVSDRCQGVLVKSDFIDGGPWLATDVQIFTSQPSPWPDLPRYPDIAVLDIPYYTHPCVRIARPGLVNSTCIAIGYPSQAGVVSLSTTYLDADGRLDVGDAWMLKLRSANVPTGMSGGPVLSTSDGSVTAVTIATRGDRYPHGSLASPLVMLGETFDELERLNSEYHQLNPIWRNFARPREIRPNGPPRFFGVPERNDHFVGRTAELKDLRSALARPHALAIVPSATIGMGGIGKTELVVHYCHNFRAEYTFIWWFSAASRKVLIEQLGTIAPTIGVQAAGVEAYVVATRVREWLEDCDSPWLLVLDNVDDPESVRGLLPTAGRGHVILTSRSTLWSSRGVATLELQPLKVNDATRLLMASSDTKDEPGAYALSEVLGGLPLALRQAGALVGQAGLTFKQYEDSFSRHAGELMADNPAGLFRSEGDAITLATVWSASIRAAETQQSFARPLLLILACCEAENIPKDLLAQDSQGQLRVRLALSALARYSLIRVESQYVSLHRLVQANARSAASGHELNSALHETLALLERIVPDDPDDSESWPDFSAMLPHVVRCVENSVANRVQNDAGVAVAARAAGYLNARGARDDALELLKSAEFLSPGPGRTAEIYAVRARVERNLGRVDEAHRHLQLALSILQSAPPSHTLADVHVMLGRILQEQNNLDDAAQHFTSGISVLNALGFASTRRYVAALNHLGRSLMFRNDLDSAKVNLEEALTLDRSIHARAHADTAWTLDNLGLVELALGNLLPAERLFREALEIEAEIHGPQHPRSAWSLRNLGSCLSRLGRQDEALVVLEMSLYIIESATPDNLGEISRTLTWLERVERSRGNVARAQDFADRIRSILDNAQKP